MRITAINYELVRNIPEQLQPGILYISSYYHTALHLCCCGCGEETVTPLDDKPGGTGWTVKYDDNKVSLSPSIGNHQFACKSHYFITDGKIKWC